MITMPRKGSLLLSSSSIVKLSEGCIPFSVNKNSEADETPILGFYYIIKAMLTSSINILH